jgi:hypothetical protein
VEKRECRASNWIFCGSPGNTNFLINNILADRDYRFRVCAVNSIGSSDYAETERPADKSSNNKELNGKLTWFRLFLILASFSDPHQPAIAAVAGEQSTSTTFVRQDNYTPNICQLTTISVVQQKEHMSEIENQATISPVQGPKVVNEPEKTLDKQHTNEASNQILKVASGNNDDHDPNTPNKSTVINGQQESFGGSSGKLI